MSSLPGLLRSGDCMYDVELLRRLDRAAPMSEADVADRERQRR